MAKCLLLAGLVLAAIAAQAKSSEKPPLPLTASNFFQPLRPSFARSPEWPQQLHLVYNKIWADDFGAVLQAHTWRIVFECDGGPVSAAYLQSLKLLEGYYSSGIEFRYDEQLAHRTTFLYRDAKAERDETEQDIDAPYSVVSFSNEWYSIRYGKSLHQAPEDNESLNPADVQPVRVKETNELVLEIFNNHTTKEVCPNGHKMHFIMVPVNEAIM
jgi:hypothetical protein